MVEPEPEPEVEHDSETETAPEPKDELEAQLGDATNADSANVPPPASPLQQRLRAEAATRDATKMAQLARTRMLASRMRRAVSAPESDPVEFQFRGDQALGLGFSKASDGMPLRVDSVAPNSQASRMPGLVVGSSLHSVNGDSLFVCNISSCRLGSDALRARCRGGCRRPTAPRGHRDGQECRIHCAVAREAGGHDDQLRGAWTYRLLQACPAE